MKIIVEAYGKWASLGKVTIGDYVFSCTLGRGGIINAEDKIEGDGTTPAGEYPLRYLLWRADRNPMPETGLIVKELTPSTAWCEDPSHADYNKEVTLPHPTDVDRMYREDNLYDYCIVIGHNDSPIISGKGSAIFMHLSRPDLSPTAGCIGLKKEDLIKLLKLCSADTEILIKPV